MNVTTADLCICLLIWLLARAKKQEPCSLVIWEDNIFNYIPEDLCLFWLFFFFSWNFSAYLRDNTGTSAECLSDQQFSTLAAEVGWQAATEAIGLLFLHNTNSQVSFLLSVLSKGFYSILRYGASSGHLWHNSYLCWSPLLLRAGESTRSQGALGVAWSSWVRVTVGK